MTFSSSKGRCLGGFSVIRWLVVGFLALVSLGFVIFLARVQLPVWSQRSLMARNLENLNVIAAGCRAFAGDFEGLYPSYNPSHPSQPLVRSTDAFNLLIPQYIQRESVFWIPNSHSHKRERPTEDGILQTRECVYFFVRGLSVDFPSSPLLGDGLMMEPGIYSEHHPFLLLGKAAVCFADTRVEFVELSGTEPGATLGAKGNILKKRTYDARGESSGGWLTVDPGHVLLPE